jgi:hypothetical protein
VSDGLTQSVVPQTSYVENTASMSGDESELSDCDEPELGVDLEESSPPNAQGDLRLVESVDKSMEDVVQSGELCDDDSSSRSGGSGNSPQ